MAVRSILSLLGFLVVALDLLSGCGTHCNAFVECGAPLVVVAHVPLPVSAPGGLSLAFCRNGACSNGPLTSDAATLAGAFRVDVVAQVVNDSATDVVLTPAFDGYVDGSGDVADGDSYEVRVANGATVLVDDTRTINFAHTSAGCRNGSCFTASYAVGPT